MSGFGAPSRVLAMSPGASRMWRGFEERSRRAGDPSWLPSVPRNDAPGYPNSVQAESPMFSTTSSWNDVPAAAPPFLALNRSALAVQVGAPPAWVGGGDAVAGGVVGLASIVGDATDGLLG